MEFNLVVVMINLFPAVVFFCLLYWLNTSFRNLVNGFFSKDDREEFRY